MSSSPTPTTPRSYGTAKGWRIFIYLFAPPMALGALSSPFWIAEDRAWDAGMIGLAATFWAFGLFLLYALYETIKCRHIITDKALIYQGAFRRKVLPLNAIRGYRIDQQYTRITPISPAYPKIRIGYTSEKYEEIQLWLAAHYPDLDTVEQQEAEEALLQDTTLGDTVEERESKLTKAKKVTRFLNAAGLGAGAWLLFLPQPYTWALGACLLLPLTGASAMFLHRGTIRPDEKPNSAYPSVVGALFIPCIGLAIQHTLDSKILDFSLVWPIAVVVGTLFALLLLLGAGPFLFRGPSRLSIITSVVSVAALYGFVATLAYNCGFDESRPVRHKTTVLDKHSSSGKTTTYYLNVAPWGPRTTAEDVSVSEELYDQVQAGATVHVYRFKGQLGIPWFVVGQ